MRAAPLRAIKHAVKQAGVARGFAAAKSGELPEHLWTELYFQSTQDRSIVPEGLHTMSVFAQYVPYRFEAGDWESADPRCAS